MNPVPHILVVEDDEALRQLNTRVLLRSGYEVSAAGDGATAWNELRSKRYDLMITDHTMPAMSGVELLKKLHDAKMAIPVILATGTLPTDEAIQYPWVLPAAMLLKPYTAEELVTTVNDVLRAIDCARENIVPPPGWVRSLR